MDAEFEFYSNSPDNWRQRLDYIVNTMKEVSRQASPEDMVAAYSRRMRASLPSHRFLSLSRRGVEPPKFIVARDIGEHETDEQPRDVWRNRDGLPVLEGGLLGELLFSNEAHLLEDFVFDDDDPAAAYLAGYRSLMAIPVFDGGETMNLIVLLRREPDGFQPGLLPQMVWTSNLFGRATYNLVLRRELEDAYEAIDREMNVIADIQRALLPDRFPEIPTLDLAAHYEPARRAGGDYYDFFPLEGGRWGILIADVSGHGSPAAVHMAITHALAHTRPPAEVDCDELLGYVNHQLASRYTIDGATFVTAFFAVYDPDRKRLTYSSAGHPPPRVKRCRTGQVFTLDQAAGIAMGILPHAEYPPASIDLQAGDQIIFYTDGITEAFSVNHEMFGVERLDQTLENCALSAQGLIDDVLERLEQFAQGREPDDDRTLLVARVN